MLAQTWRVSDLLAQLEGERDPWRATNPFSPDMAAVHERLFDSSTSRAEKADNLVGWLAASQPCFFGRIEAKRKRLALCVLTENDLGRSDQEIRILIENERRAWKELARKGESHGFLIAAVSEAVALARQGPLLKDFAESICDLYLSVREADKIYHDDVVLQLSKPGLPAANLRWRVGVNYFSAQGDGRWWHDHRFPGGMAFSMNSVGHMARAFAEQLIAAKPELAENAASVPRDKLVYWALPTAMRIIGAKVSESKRGTWLAEHGTFPEDKEPPTFDQRHARFGHDLANFSHNRYVGRYHTDVSIPSDFFRDELWEHEKIGVRDDLFFTYLHSLVDPDYESMGIGIEELLMEASGASNETT